MSVELDLMKVRKGTPQRHRGHGNCTERLWRCQLLFVVLVTIVWWGAPVGAQTRRTSVDLIVRGGSVVTMNADNRIIENGAIAVRGNRIVAVGTQAEIDQSYSSTNRIEAANGVIIPGLVNAHTHIPMTLFRGLADDLELYEWLTRYIFPAEAKNVTQEFVRVGTRLGLAEMIRSGTTTYCDMYYFEDAIAEETARAGMRGVLGQAIIDFPVPDHKTPADALRFTEKFIAAYRNHPLIVPAIAPHAPYTVSETNLQLVRALSERTGAPILIHVAETQKEVDDVLKAKGNRPIEYLARIGFLNSRVTAAHVIHATEAEIELLRRNEVGVSHNPQSNMKLASGVAPVPLMLRAGVRLGLGTDGAASNNDLHLWEEIDTAAKLHKVATLNPQVVSARDAFTMATIGGARALHLEKEIGSLEPGKRADIAIVDFDDAHQTPFYNLYSHLVYATKAADVRTVIIDGRIVMRDRRLLTLDETGVKRDARQYRERILRSLETREHGGSHPAALTNGGSGFQRQHK